MNAARITPDEARSIRDAVAHAIVGIPAGLRDRLDTDPDATLQLVDAARAAAEESSRLLRESIASARAAGHSWGAVGALLGVSKQAAQQRFGSPAAPAPASCGSLRVLSPVTAFDEMAALDEAGRHGWHSVGYGPLHHVLERSGVQWEHRRVLWGTSSRARLADAGWALVGHATFPWAYWARPTDRPAEPDPQS